jgi:nitroreductase
MNVLEAIKTRRSIRSYTDKPVSDDAIQTIIGAGMLAPSAGNQQPWHFIVVRDRAKLDAVPSFHPYAKMITQASVAIVLCGDPVGKKWPDFWAQDCSAAAQNMLLAAREMGLGTVWTGVYPDQKRMEGARELFAIPDAVYPFAIIPVGWPEAKFTTMDRFNPSLIHHEAW